MSGLGALLLVYMLGPDLYDSIENGFFTHQLLGRLLATSVICILASAMFFSSFGFKDTPECFEGTLYLDGLYFSVVSFSTLGYGDITAVGSGRIVSGILAVLGNLHLALIAGASFHWISKNND